MGPTFREDEIGHRDPRGLPSIRDTRAPARARTDPECGHVMGFRFDPALDALSLLALRGAFALASPALG